MQREVHLPTISQIFHVRQLIACGLYDITTVARLTGVSRQDVFRIEKSMFGNKQQTFTVDIIQEKRE